MIPLTVHSIERCKPFTELLARISEKWSLFIVMLLGNGPMRFSEIKRAADGISQRMLTLTLRHLERDGLIVRSVISLNPNRVDYALSELGQSLKAPVEALGDWAFANRTVVEYARQAFDSQHDGHAPDKLPLRQHVVGVD